MTVRAATGFVVAALVAGCGGGDDGDRLVGNTSPQPAPRIHLSSPAFINHARLQERYTCDGAGDEPVVRAGTVPASTSELVLIVSDPDAGGSGAFVHVTRYALSPRGDGSVSEGGTEGRNSTGKVGWTPPCPPKGDGPHRYVWSVYALRDASDLPAGANPAQVADAVKDPLAAGTLTAQYDR